MNITVVTNGLSTLDRDECRTSSQLFELSLASGLSGPASVEILLLRPTKRAERDGLTLTGRARRAVLWDSIRDLVRPSSNEEGWVLTFGYDPRHVLLGYLLALSKKRRWGVFIFDNHWGAIEKRSPVRRFVLDVYFRMGRRLAVTLASRVFLLNQEASTRLKPSRAPHFLTRIPYEAGAIRSPRRSPSQPLRILYAGALEDYNGIGPLLEAMDLLEPGLATLRIVGNGSLQEEVATRCLGGNSEYLGLVTHSEVERLITESDLLVNLRDTSHPVAHFSFPSKLVEYLASGVPVLSTPVVTDRDFMDAVYITEDLAPSSIALAIKEAALGSGYSDRATLGSAYVRRHHEAARVFDEMWRILDM